MSNVLLKEIISNIARSELRIYKDKLIDSESKGDRRILIDKIQSLTFTDVLCSPYVKAQHDYDDDIRTIGISNVCRYFDNLCAQYSGLKGGKEWRESALRQKYFLECNGESMELPLTTRGGDPSDYINELIGVYSTKNLSECSEEELNLIYDAFNGAAEELRRSIEGYSDESLPYYDGMRPDQVRKSLNSLVDGGMLIIDNAFEGYRLTGSSKK